MNIDYSRVDVVDIAIRGDRDGVFTLKPIDGELLSNVKMTFGVGGKKVGNEIIAVDNLDNTYTFSFNPSDFEFREYVDYQIYGLTQYPEIEICIGKIKYYNKIR